MNVDDPRLTAYALDELSEPERVEIEKLLSSSEQARQLVDETRAFAGTLKQAFQTDNAARADKPANLVDIRDDPWFWSVARPLAIAAMIALLAIFGAVAVSRYQS